MRAEHEPTNGPVASPPNLEDGSLLSQLQAECERLRQQVTELEAERDSYRAECYAWARREFERKGLPSEEELKRRIEQEDGVPLEAFVGGLERIARGS